MNEFAYRTILAWITVLESESSQFRFLAQDEYEEVTFSLWALEELLQLIWDSPWTPATETVLAFALLMTENGGLANTDAQRRIFRIARDTAFELLENLEEVEE